jgi:UDP-GlcNAc3NAcA epimerase
MKILTIIGARPQFIKAATVSRRLAEVDDAHENIVHTGQHFDSNMSGVFFSDLGIPEPSINLGIQGGPHGEMTGRMLEAIERVLFNERPDVLLIYGDTNSTLAGALAAAKQHIPIAHVEAGLRSFNRRMPEEINRVVADHVSTLLFTPTDTATLNLRHEGIDPARIRQVGDVMFDAATFYAKKAIENSTILTELKIDAKDYVLATIHRQENTDAPERLGAIFDALNQVAKKMRVILPLHPRTRQFLDSSSSINISDSVQIIEPVGYLDMVMLERNASVVATDSGGVQKEAYFHGVPCVTLRDETEWVELAEMGWNRIAPPGKVDIANAIESSIGRRGISGTPYGDGHAAQKIVEVLLNQAL